MLHSYLSTFLVNLDLATFSFYNEVKLTMSK
jgi:hypothetical protein